MLEMKWKITVEIHMKDQKTLDENWVRSYTLIWDKYCSREIQMAIEEMPDFDTSIVNQPIVLLQRVDNLTHTPMKDKYTPPTLVEVLIRFLKIKQSNNESLLDYLSIFKSKSNVMLGQVDRRLIDGYTERTPDYLALAATDTVDQSDETART